jgi:uncharacterized protein
VSETHFARGIESLAPDWLARAAPFAAFIALLALQPVLETSHLDARWLVALRGVLPLALILFFRRHYVELRAPPATPAREWILAMATGIAVFFAWIELDRPGIAFDVGRGFAPLDPDGAIDWPLAWVRLSTMALVVPLMEELFWRSFLMRWIVARDFLRLDPRIVGPGAIVLSSALFATEHSMWAAGLVAGLAYAWLYRRTANLWTSILSHATTNGTLGIWILATSSWRFW